MGAVAVAVAVAVVDVDVVAGVVAAVVAVAVAVVGVVVGAVVGAVVVVGVVAVAGGKQAVQATLNQFNQQLRDYQQLCLGDAVQFVERCLIDRLESPPYRRIYACPTGTGKGTIQLALLRTLREAGADAWILTPSLEVVRGFLERCGGGDCGDASEDALHKAAAAIYVTTPPVLKARCLDGLRGVPDVLIYDEVHHATMGGEVSGAIFAMAPASVFVGFTATPYRGTPAGTKALRDAWGDPTLVLSYPEALAQGVAALPRVEMLPLLDDDTVKVVDGEFVQKDLNKATLGKIDALAAIVARFRTAGAWPQDRNADPLRDDDPPTHFDVPTCVSVPSTESVGALVEALDRLGVDAVPITQATKAKDRAAAYAACRERKAALVQIKVVSEGVDLPWLRRLVDARPVVSPVAWVQQLGRITRPGGQSHYVCTNRNLERHAYLLQGALPRSAVAEAQKAFDGPSKRTLGRSIGLEALGRLKAIPLPLEGGVRTTMYALWRSDGEGKVDEWVVLLDPCHDEPVVARREVIARDGEERAYGKWTRADMPVDFEGYATSKWTGKLSVKQRQWWSKASKRYGLDPTAVDELTARQFAALPVLSELKLSMRAQEVST